MEDTKRDLNMYKLTRRMMVRLEKRLKTVIPWAGALRHDHTDIRHVHILAALPRRLQKYELGLIQEATLLCRRCSGGNLILEKSGNAGRILQNTENFQSVWRDTLKPATDSSNNEERAVVSKYLPIDNSKIPLTRWKVRILKTHTSCTCPRCHFPQSHDAHGALFMCLCGLNLHRGGHRSRGEGKRWGSALCYLTLSARSKRFFYPSPLF